MDNNTQENKTNRSQPAKTDVDRLLEDIGDLLRTVFVLSIFGGLGYLSYIKYAPQLNPGVLAYAGAEALLLILLFVGILRRRVILRAEYRKIHGGGKSGATGMLYSPCPCWEVPRNSGLARWMRRRKSFKPKIFKKCHNKLFYWRIDRFLYRGSLFEFLILILLIVLTLFFIVSLNHWFIGSMVGFP